MNTAFGAVVALLHEYFDGLYHGDTARLARVFHPQAMYACASSGTLVQWSMAEYFPVVDKRVSPASLGQAREDHIVSIAFAGPVTAIATVRCTVAARRFTDLLTCVRLDGRWSILAKVFHAEEAVGRIETGAGRPLEGRGN